MNKKLNILFLASWYPNKVQPSNGNFIQQHAQAVASHCNVYTLHIIARNQPEKLVLEQNLHGEVLETIVYYKKINSKIPGLSHIQKQLIRKKAHEIGFHKILEKAKHIEITHLNVCFPAGMFALHLKSKFNIPYIMKEHWTAFLETDPNKISAIEMHFIKKIAAQASCICPVSQDLKNAMSSLGINNPFKVIPNVVDPDIFKHQPAELNTTTQRILHISNLNDTQKNITGILKVVQRLYQKNLDFHITIAGNGAIDPLIKKAKELHIPDAIISFEMEKTRAEVAQLMNTHHLFLLFSNYENLPCVIAEALTVGLPVIATDVGGVSEMLNDTNGIVIPANNETALATQLSAFIKNDVVFNRFEISEKAKKIYNSDVVGLQFLERYHETLEH